MIVVIHFNLDFHFGYVQTFGSCSCFEGVATKGYCPGDVSCNSLPKYLGMIVLGAVISSSAKTGNQLTTFRAVEPMDKSFTNGLNGAMLSIFGACRHRVGDRRNS